MIDQSYYVALLPDAGEPLNVYRANAIEENLRYLIRQWPAFEAEARRALVGEHGTIFVPGTASPAEGAEVTLLQHLPRFSVVVDGDVEHMAWAGEGWELTSRAGSRAVLARVPDTADRDGANGALRGLTLWADWNADLTISLAAEREDGTLRVVRRALTRMLFRAEMTWGRLGRERKAWAALTGETWAQTRELEKE